MTAIFTVLATILIFFLMVFVHEFGHFAMAKLLKVQVLEFAIGMGPKLFSKKKGETEYSLRAFPIGGFCALEGEDAPATENSFCKKPAWVKLLVLVAGAFMNFLLGFLLLVFSFSTMQEVVVPKVATVAQESIGAEGGLLPGDQILSLGNEAIHITSDLYYAKEKLTDEPFLMVVKRQGEKVTLTLTPRKTEGVLDLGILLSKEKNNPLLTVQSAYHTTTFYGSMIIKTVIGLFRGEVPLSSLSGPVGIVTQIGTAVQESQQTGFAGILNLIQLAVLLTINLGVFNLLPIPALDGGRVFFVLVGLVFRKPIPPEKEGFIHMIGFLLLIVVSIFVAYKDVLRLF